MDDGKLQEVCIGCHVTVIGNPDVVTHTVELG